MSEGFHLDLYHRSFAHLYLDTEDSIRRASMRDLKDSNIDTRHELSRMKASKIWPIAQAIILRL